MEGHKFTSAEQTLSVRSMIGTCASGNPLGLPLRKSVGRVPCKVVYFHRNSPMTLSTCMRTLVIPLVFLTSTGSSLDLPLVNAGMTSFARFNPTLSLTVKPLSVMTMSPGNSFSRNPQFSVRNLSEVRPPHASDTKETVP